MSGKSLWVDVDRLEIREATIKPIPTTAKLVRVIAEGLDKAVPVKHIFPPGFETEARKFLRGCIEEEVGRSIIDISAARIALQRAEFRLENLRRDGAPTDVISRAASVVAYEGSQLERVLAYRKELADKHRQCTEEDEDDERVS